MTHELEGAGDVLPVPIVKATWIGSKRAEKKAKAFYKEDDLPSFLALSKAYPKVLMANYVPDPFPEDLRKKLSVAAKDEAVAPHHFSLLDACIFDGRQNWLETLWGACHEEMSLASRACLAQSTVAVGTPEMLAFVLRKDPGAFHTIHDLTLIEDDSIARVEYDAVKAAIRKGDLGILKIILGDLSHQMECDEGNGRHAYSASMAWNRSQILANSLTTGRHDLESLKEIRSMFATKYPSATAEKKVKRPVTVEGDEINVDLASSVTVTDSVAQKDAMPEFARLVIERMEALDGQMRARLDAMQYQLDVQAQAMSRLSEELVLAKSTRPAPTPPLSRIEAFGKRLTRSAPSDGVSKKGFAGGK